MKRTFRVTFAAMVAIGLIFMMGFSGAAAASDYDSQSAEISQDQKVTQEASASSDGGTAIAFGDDAVANTGNSVTQDNTNSQGAEIGQFSESIEGSTLLDL